MWYSTIDLLPHNHIHHLVQGNLGENSIMDVEVWRRYLQHLSIILSITVSFVYLHVCFPRWQGTENSSLLLYICSANRAQSSIADIWRAPDQNGWLKKSNFCFVHNYITKSKITCYILKNKRSELLIYLKYE